jgi:pyrroline-5-carboxylate reductase
MAFRLVIVGGGKMGSALARGLMAAKWCAPEELCVVARTLETRESLAAQMPKVALVGVLEATDVGPETGAVLAVKPDYAENVARGLGAIGVTRLLSVVAGLSAQRLEAAMAGPVAVVRAMPNTPVLVGKGVSAISGGSHVTSEDLTWAESILGAVGTVVRVPERQLDAVSGLSGAMPAYLYLVVEALIEAGVHQGLTRDVATELVVHTFEGAGDLLERSGESPEVLRSNVTSPGGVTAAGLRMLESRAVRAAFLEAVAAAAERSRQLGR